MPLIEDKSSITCLSSIIEENYELQIKHTLGCIDIGMVFKAQRFNSKQDDLVYQVEAEYEGKKVLIDLHIVYQHTPVMDNDLQEVLFKHRLLTDERKKKMKTKGKSFISSFPYSDGIPVVSVFLHNGYDEQSERHKSGSNQFLLCRTSYMIGSDGDCDESDHIGTGTKKVIFLNLGYFRINRKDEKKMKPDLYQFLLLQTDLAAFKDEFPTKEMMDGKIVNLYDKVSEARGIFHEESEFNSTLSELVTRSTQRRHDPQILNILKKALYEIELQNRINVQSDLSN